jgi:hypothetical protein
LGDTPGTGSWETCPTIGSGSLLVTWDWAAAQAAGPLLPAVTEDEPEPIVFYSPVSGATSGRLAGCQPAVQDLICGRALELPFIIVVKPNVLPLPLERIVSTVLLLPSVALPFQVVLIDCGEVTATTTVQLLAPLTVTEVLYRSPQTLGVVTDVLQPLPPGGGVVGLPPPGGVVPSGATARPVDGEIMPGHRLRLVRLAMICGIASRVF